MSLPPQTDGSYNGSSSLSVMTGAILLGGKVKSTGTPFKISSSDRSRKSAGTELPLSAREGLMPAYTRSASARMLMLGKHECLRGSGWAR